MTLEPARPLFTIGYEGVAIDDFIDTLHAAGIELLVDVREVSVSRRPGFSKNRLAAHLAEAGIGYLHLRELGDPKPGRLAARQGDHAAFRAIYAAHVASERAQQGLARLADAVAGARSCLMCYERDPEHCHRTIVANHLKYMHLQVIDLFVDGGSGDERTRSAGGSHRPGQGAAAA